MAKDCPLKDGAYDIPMFKTSRNIDPQACIKGNASPEPIDRYKMTVRMILCSHKISQNIEVNQLIKWKKNPDALADTLNKFTFVEMKDILQCFVPIVKCLLEIIDAVPKMQMFAYNTLIFVFGLLVDDKTDRYNNWMDSLKKEFTEIPKTLHNTITRCMVYYLGKLDSTSHAKYIRLTLKAFPHVFKVLCHLYTNSDAEEKDQKEFLENLKTLFNCLNELISLKDPLKVALQSTCLQVYGEILPDLEKLFSPNQLVDVVHSFLKCIVANDSLSTLSMNTEKLLFVQCVANCDFYLISDTYIKPDGILYEILEFLKVNLTGNRNRKAMIECSYCLSVILVSISIIFFEFLLKF